MAPRWCFGGGRVVDSKKSIEHKGIDASILDLLLLKIHLTTARVAHTSSKLSDFKSLATSTKKQSQK